MTPPSLAAAIVQHFKPSGALCEPCYGEGAFFKELQKFSSSCVEFWEISLGKDFLTADIPEGHFDWIITNPPWSRDLFNAFLDKALLVSDNVVFLVAMNKLMTRSRMETIDTAEFGFKEILRVDRPRSWPSSGFEYAAMHLQHGWTGDCKFSKLTQPSTEGK